MSKDFTNTLTDDLYEKTRSELNAFLKETDALLKAGDAVNEDRTDVARSRLRAFLDSASKSVTSEGPLVEHGVPAFEKAKAYVKEKPWHAVAAAAGVGLVVSILLNRRQP